ncbi:MAG: transcriptional regulator EpsA [Propionivibrio sp.]|uniref:XrtB/PEP-CTERM-associated transcriptional regulator EpsA n=1 Tax=Propionivibrio sp. TaxID=2212460 RepID=UPI001A44E70E|nr:XrtB/PEP-CTERM-associated transcriptional regulator EpsA [Propionivibrio sp.]MBL8415632.1 transcriptional regulator EpsA [Propionivibrio sp.]
MNAAFYILTDEEQENLLRAIETSLQVRRRHQFYLWTQGPLQAFIPHKILISLFTRDGKEVMAMDRFNSCIVSEQTFEEVCDKDDGLVMQAMSAWREAGESPILMAPGKHLPLALYERFGHRLEGINFGSAAGHGSAPVDGSGINSSFFFFAQMPNNLTLRHAYFIELLMPNIHMAFLRTLGRSERVALGVDDSMCFYDLGKTVTERELEILVWVQEGKSNQEIATFLNISPLTVKNHVQKILRKLKVRNRAQAVSKATAMRLIVGYNGSA